MIINFLLVGILKGAYFCPGQSPPSVFSTSSSLSSLFHKALASITLHNAQCQKLLPMRHHTSGCNFCILPPISVFLVQSQNRVWKLESETLPLRRCLPGRKSFRAREKGRNVDFGLTSHSGRRPEADFLPGGHLRNSP